MNFRERSVLRTTQTHRYGATHVSLLLGIATAISGCASQMAPADRANFESSLNVGDYSHAAAAAIQAGNITPDGQTQNIVWSLDAGSALFDEGDMKSALPIFDTTERLAQANDLDRVHAAIDYRYTTYDGVMTNVYKAMAFLAEGDRENARVEFNRAENRQQRAEELFKQQADYAATHNQAAANPGFGDLIRQAQQNPEYAASSATLAQLAKYQPFENPFATYMAGVFFINNGDFDKGRNKLDRAASILGPNSQANFDLKWVVDAHQQGALPPQVWVVFENGQSATFHEMRLALPMVTGQVMTLALPVLAQNPPAYAALQVQADGSAGVATLPAGSFDAVMASEFSRQRGLILAESVAEVIMKNGISIAARKTGNIFLQQISAVTANISTADTRSWVALPKEFQAARIAVPADGTLHIFGSEGQALGDAHVPAGHSSIVWVKAQRAGAHPAIEVFPL